jgi:hypothetical protein
MDLKYGIQCLLCNLEGIREFDIQPGLARDNAERHAQFGDQNRSDRRSFISEIIPDFSEWPVQQIWHFLLCSFQHVWNSRTSLRPTTHSASACCLNSLKKLVHGYPCQSCRHLLTSCPLAFAFWCFSGAPTKIPFLPLFCSQRTPPLFLGCRSVALWRIRVKRL